MRQLSLHVSYVRVAFAQPSATYDGSGAGGLSFPLLFYAAYEAFLVYTEASAMNQEL